MSYLYNGNLYTWEAGLYFGTWFRSLWHVADTMTLVLSCRNGLSFINHSSGDIWLCLIAVHCIQFQISKNSFSGAKSLLWKTLKSTYFHLCHNMQNVIEVNVVWWKMQRFIYVKIVLFNVPYELHIMSVNVNMWRPLDLLDIDMIAGD